MPNTNPPTVAEARETHCAWGCGRLVNGKCPNAKCPRLANDPRCTCGGYEYGSGAAHDFCDHCKGVP